MEVIAASSELFKYTIFAKGEVILQFAISPNSLWFIAIDFVIGKLYANSLLATLNTRNALRSNTTSDLNSVHLSNLAFQSEGSDTVCTSYHPSI